MIILNRRRIQQSDHSEHTASHIQRSHFRTTPIFSEPMHLFWSSPKAPARSAMPPVGSPRRQYVFLHVEGPNPFKSNHEKSNARNKRPADSFFDQRCRNSRVLSVPVSANVAAVATSAAMTQQWLSAYKSENPLVPFVSRWLARP